MLLDEELLGVYENSSTNTRANLIFTTRGVYLFDQGWICLEYAQIAKTQVPGWGSDGFNKQLANVIIVRYQDDQTFRLIFHALTCEFFPVTNAAFPIYGKWFDSLAEFWHGFNKSQSDGLNAWMQHCFLL